MTRDEIKQYLVAKYPIEDEACEWKEASSLKHFFNGQPGNDIVSYVSAISNMEGGNLVLGVEDTTLEVKGIKEFNNLNRQNIKLRLVEQCTNLPSEGLDIEEIVADDSGETVWAIQVPKHPFRLPVYAHKKAWQRVEDSLVEMRPDRREAILNESRPFTDDWSMEIVPDATIEDLDPEAIAKARKGFCERYPDKANEVPNWDDSTFLDKAKVTIKGKITRAALLLLGREESVHFLHHNSQINWRLRTDTENAAEIFTIPFLLSTTRVLEQIRNYRIKIFPRNTLIPAEVWKYDTKTILEALHNCIAHQDYTRGERILVTEEPEKLTFENAGEFFEGEYQDYIEGKTTPRRYRNNWLAQAMVNLKMIDTQGYGIHEMFKRQRERYLPMPDYDRTDPSRVKLMVPGQVINEQYSILLMERADLNLMTAVLLDRVQKGKHITPEAVSILRKQKLIEGRMPNIHISKRIAQVTHSEIEYTELKGLDDDYFREMIIQALSNATKLRRDAINKLLIDKLPKILDDKMKKNRIDYLLKTLRQAERIYCDRERWWHLTEIEMKAKNSAKFPRNFRENIN